MNRPVEPFEKSRSQPVLNPGDSVPAAILIHLPQRLSVVAILRKIYYLKKVTIGRRFEVLV